MHGEDLAPENATDQVEDHTAHQSADGPAEVTDADTPVDAPDDGSVEAGGDPTHDASDHTPALDLDAIQQDLADVEVALARLDAGTYWTDEVTGEPLPEALLAEHPTARRA